MAKNEFKGDWIEIMDDGPGSDGDKAARELRLDGVAQIELGIGEAAA